MRKEKVYDRVRFSADVFRDALTELFSDVEGSKEGITGRLSVETDDGLWYLESEDEFFNEYRRSSKGAIFNRKLGVEEIWVYVRSRSASVDVNSVKRDKIHRVFDIFDRNTESFRLPELATEPKKPVIFIGHGRSPLWRDLKDHLADKHGYTIEAYEIGARAGHAIRDILEDMLTSSSFALLIMTGEDETSTGGYRARQNVIHEAGLFQGRLGFNKAIILLEEGAEEFSNIHGIEQIRFKDGNIKETFGDVVATIKREFPRIDTTC
jgi:predicted nucleotide-binding protein